MEEPRSSGIFYGDILFRYQNILPMNVVLLLFYFQRKNPSLILIFLVLTSVLLVRKSASSFRNMNDGCLAAVQNPCGNFIINFITV